MAKLISIGQIIDKTWENYTDHFKNWMRVSSLLFIVSIAWITGSLLSPMSNVNFLIDQGLISPLQTFGLGLSAVASTLLFPIFSFWIAIMFVKFLDEIKHKEKFNLQDIISFGIRRFIPALIVAILYVLIMASSLLALAPGFLLIALNISIDGGAVLGATSLLVFFLGNIAAIAILVFFGVTFTFAFYELLSGKKGIFESIKSSYLLVKGRFWATLVKWVAPKILIVAATIFLNVLLAVIFVLIFSGVQESQMFWRQISSIVTNLSFTGVIVLTAPLWIIADYTLYDSLRNSK